MFDIRIEIKIHGAETDHAFFASVPRVGDFISLLNSKLEQQVEKVVFQSAGEQESEIHVYLEKKGANPKLARINLASPKRPK